MKKKTLPSPEAMEIFRELFHLGDREVNISFFFETMICLEENGERRERGEKFFDT